MTGPQTDQHLTHETLEQHRQIHFYLDQVATTLDALDESAKAGGADNVELMRRLAAQLQSLSERLVEHHEMEEIGGMHAAIIDAMPEARGEVRQLREQHHRMIEVLEMGRIHAQYGQSDEAEDLRVDLQQYLEMIRKHELAEESILEEAIERIAGSHTA